MKKLFLVLFMTATLFGCKKDDQNINLNLTMNLSGNITVTVTDNSGAAVTNTTVKLNESSSMSSSPLEEKNTDGNGKVTFENVLEGDYYIYIKDVILGGKEYTVFQPIQVVSGKTKPISINPQSYVGTIEFTFSDNSTYPSKPITGNSVVLFTTEDYFSLGGNPTFTSMQSIAFATGTTDSNGKVLFSDVPAGKTFTFMIYNSTKKYVQSYNTYNLDKGEEYKPIVTISSSYWTDL